MTRNLKKINLQAEQLIKDSNTTIDKYGRKKAYLSWEKANELCELIVDTYSKYNKTPRITKKQQEFIDGHYCDAPIFQRFISNLKTIRMGHSATEIIIGQEFSHKDEVLELINKVLTPFNDQLWFGDALVDGSETGCKLTTSKNNYEVRTELTEDGKIVRF